MKKEYFYVYCKGILGVRTSERDFRWIYGSVAPQTSSEEYEGCIIKFDVCIKPERKLTIVKGCDKRFQAYMWDSKTRTIYCRRTFLGWLEIGFNIMIAGNTIRAEIGENYYRFVKNRVMNLHGCYYLLADLANILLLKNGFLSLYASAVYCKADDRSIVLFAPPNTGKTLTAIKLCECLGCTLVGEDVLITDARRVYACPWTLSYRRANSGPDGAGALCRLKKAVDVEKTDSSILTDLAVLLLGKLKVSSDENDIFQLTSMLNGYLFAYYSSPIVKILGYFDEEYRCNWNDYAADMLKKIIQNCNCSMICVNDPMDFIDVLVLEKMGKIHEGFGNN